MTIPDPACMTADEYALWLEGANCLRQWFRVPMTDPCADCVPAFAAEQDAIGRCNGTPGVSRMITQGRKLASSEAVRESNRAAQARWRERNQEAIRERRRGYFAERHLRRNAVAEPRTGTLG